MYSLQSVTCSLSVMGFGESIMELTGLEDPWVAKGVAIALVILLLGKAATIILTYTVNKQTVNVPLGNNFQYYPICTFCIC